MKQLSMSLKDIPPGYYLGFVETIYCLSPNKVYMVRQTTIEEDHPMVKYFFRLPTPKNIYEGLITEQLYNGIIKDISFAPEDIKYQQVYEYLFGKDTIRVVSELDMTLTKESNIIVAIGPEENKEWQYEFQKYHA